MIELLARVRTVNSVLKISGDGGDDEAFEALKAATDQLITARRRRRMYAFASLCGVLGLVIGSVATWWLQQEPARTLHIRWPPQIVRLPVLNVGESHMISFVLDTVQPSDKMFVYLRDWSGAGTNLELEINQGDPVKNREPHSTSWVSHEIHSGGDTERRMVSHNCRGYRQIVHVRIHPRLVVDRAVPYLDFGEARVTEVAVVPGLPHRHNWRPKVD